MHFEKLDCEDDYVRSFRLKVPGGWILRSRVLTGGTNGGAHLEHIFIKDPKHTWVLEIVK